MMPDRSVRDAVEFGPNFGVHIVDSTNWQLTFFMIGNQISWLGSSERRINAVDDQVQNRRGVGGESSQKMFDAEMIYWLIQTEDALFGFV